MAVVIERALLRSFWVRLREEVMKADCSHSLLAYLAMKRGASFQQGVLYVPFSSVVFSDSMSTDRDAYSACRFQLPRINTLSPSANPSHTQFSLSAASI